MSQYKMSNRVPQEVWEERLAYCAEMMSRLRSTTAVVHACKAKYGVDKRTVIRWVAKVRGQRRAEASMVDVDARRDDIRTSFDAIYAIAMGRTTVVKDADGNPVMETVTRADGSTITKPSAKPNPDLQRALHALREIVHLDNLAKPAELKHVVKLDADVAVMPDLAAMGPAAAEALRAFLQTISPGSDVSAIAGADFKFAGDEPGK